MDAAQLSEGIARFPATSAQRRFWFQEQAKPGDPELNIAVRWEIRGSFKAADIEAAFQQITERHEILRTRFAEDAQDLWQEVVHQVRFRLGVVDLRPMPAQDHEPRVAAMARELAAHPFDLKSPGQLRVTLVQLATDRAALLVVAHHIVFDGFSIGVLGQELGQIMQAKDEGRAPDLPDLGLQYGDFALWERELEETGALEEDARYWDDKLRGAPYFELPTDFPRPAVRATSGKTLIRPFPPDFDARMNAFNKSMGISFFTLGAAVMSAALHRWTGAAEVSFAAPAAGRTDIEIEKLIGVFINTLALRIPVQPDATLRAHLSNVRDVVQEGLLHQTCPFDAVVRRLKLPRDSSRTPLVSINLNMQRVFLQERSYGRFQMISVPSHMPGVFYDMNVQIIGRDAGWKLMFDYQDSLFRTETVERLADLLLRSFELCLADPDATLADIPLETSAPAAAAASAAPLELTRRIAPDAPPDDAALHDTVRAIWADVLNLPADQCAGDFFELGGYSLKALRMIARTEAECGYRMPLADFLADSTLDGFVGTLHHALVRGDDPQADDRERLWDILTLKPGPVGSPVIATINQPFLYHALARSMSDDLEVANIFVPDQPAFERLLQQDFDAIAASAAQVLQARFGARPLLLCGHCVDGLMALRIAQKLEAAGRAPHLVVMIDAPEPSRFVGMSRRAKFQLRWSIRTRRWTHYCGEKLRGRIGWTDFLLKNQLGTGLLRRLGRAEPKTEAERLAIEVNYQLVRESRKSAFAPYRGEVILFRTRAHKASEQARVFGWSHHLAPDTPVYPLSGWHEDALIKTDAERVSAILETRVHRRGLTGQPSTARTH